MEVNKIMSHSYYNYTPPKRRDLHFQGQMRQIIKAKPVVRQNTTGFLSPVVKYLKSYAENIRETYEHKIIFAIIEKELYGSNSVDSLTHDLDKLVLYVLGFPKKFVSKFHRAHSEHHVESGKQLNLRSMICDNIASSPEFKPKKQYPLRDYFQRNEGLQHIKGLKEKLEEYNFGENLDFNEIKMKSKEKYHGAKGTANILFKASALLIGAILS